MLVVPPIKSQGIKTKLCPWIKMQTDSCTYDSWIEPFMGTGAVAFNIQPKRAILCDSNPHIINFYNAVKSGKITANSVRCYLEEEGKKLLQSNGEHYYEIRERFNLHQAPLDFLFLSRACFNGLMRFNSKGKFNVPFCKKPNRFAPALVTKITNQVENISKILKLNDYVFLCQDFEYTIKMATSKDMIYCDPPYIGRHVDYFDSWDEEQEITLREALRKTQANFIVSTWKKNRYRENIYVEKLWGDCFISTTEYFYHIGAKEKNRNSVTEALLTSYKPPQSISTPPTESKKAGSLLGVPA